MSDCISRSEPDADILATRLVELTEAGLPLVEDPWAWLAERLEIDVEAALELLQRLQAGGAIRRIAAVPNHYRLGYRHNGMTVWDVDDARIDVLGPLIGAQACVSHCYRRPRRPDWHYNLFAMVHGRSAEEIDGYRAQIRALLGSACRADDMLVSSRILKKTGLRVGGAR
jgi:DNA-binding Lrp family transcriptional regulator